MNLGIGQAQRGSQRPEGFVEQTMRDQYSSAHPLAVFAWLELPYFIGVVYEEVLSLRIAGGHALPTTVRLRNDLLKVDTWNPWGYPISPSESRYGLGENWIDKTSADFRFAPRYCPADQIEATIPRLRSAGAPYVHIEETQTVVEFEARLEEGRLPTGPWDDFLDVMPLPWFFGEEALPHVAHVVDAYRVATLPRLRYGIHPVSESLASYAVAEVRTAAGAIVQQVRYGLDKHGEQKGWQYLVEGAGIQERFYSLLREPGIEPEVALADTYSLVHMRRWTEAVVVAAAVVDHLLKLVVDARAPSPELRDALWRAYRTRHDDLFQTVLPALGVPKLSQVAPTLWKAYKDAREHRGSAVHGGRATPFQQGMERVTDERLLSFEAVARWLSEQMGRPWALGPTEQ